MADEAEEQMMQDEADEEMMQDAVSTLDESTEVEAPRVGGVANGVVWTGGSNVDEGDDEPEDTLCYRPTKPFHQMAKHHDILKRGVDKDMRLELDVGTAASQAVTLIGWVMCITSLIMMNGYDPVFRMCSMDETGTLFNEIFICQMWGQIKMADLLKWIKLLMELIGDKHDKLNLKLSGIAMRASLGPHLLQRVNSLIGPMACGPLVFLTAVHQVKYMTSNLVRNLCNELGNLNLRKIPGENVAELGEQVTAKINQIMASGQVIEDLMHLIAKAFVRGSQETFRVQAQQMYSQVLSGTCELSPAAYVMQLVAFYHGLVQSADYEPANVGKEDEDSKIQAMLAAMTARIEQLTLGGAQSGGAGNSGGGRACFRCGSKDHLIRDCDQPDTRGDNRGSSKKEIPAWRKEDPGPNGPFEKIVDGETCKWCAKCRWNKGLWMMGSKAHTTSEHRGRPTTPATPANTSAETTPVTGGMAVTWMDPLEVDFG